jgi:hypothetical protein
MPSWGIETNSLELSSPWTGGRQAYELQGARWVCDLTFRNLTELQQRELQGFVDYLCGPTGVVDLPTFVNDTFAGSAGGTILATAAAHAKVVTMAGVTGAGAAFKRGDLIGIAGRLYRVTEDAAQTAGAAEVKIAPPLRAAATGAAVSLAALVCPMSLMDDRQGLAGFRPKPVASLSLRFVESLP